jgi:hypothetical protein
MAGKLLYSQGSLLRFVSVIVASLALLLGLTPGAQAADPGTGTLQVSVSAIIDETYVSVAGTVISVYAFPDDESPVASTTVTSIENEPVVEFVLPAGSYYVKATPPATSNWAELWWISATNSDEAQSVEVRSSDVSEVWFALAPELRLSGTLTDSSSDPVENAMICLYLSEQPDTGGCSGTLADGSFEVDEFGSWHSATTYIIAVEVAGGATYYLNSSGELSDNPAAAAPVDFGSQPVQTRNLQLPPSAPRNAEIAAQVSAPQGSGLPVAGTQVSLYTDPGSDPIKTVTVGEDGEYSFIVDPGDYYVRAVPPQSSPLIAQWWDRSIDAADASVVSVGAYATLHPFFDLTLGIELAGTVADSLGNPIEHAEVRLTPVDDSFSVVFGEDTGPDGSYRISDLIHLVQPTTYTVSVYAEGAMYYLHSDGTLAETATDLKQIDLSQVGIHTLDLEIIRPDFTQTPVPTISSDTATVSLGSVLTANVENWTPLQDGFTYQWYRGNAEIDGATAATYGVVADDVSHTISVKVTGTKAGYAPATVSSAATAAVTPGDITGDKPQIEGNPEVDSVLTVNPGTWSPSGVPLTYQWFRGSSKIEGAQQPSYTVVAEDAGATISVEVTGTKPGYLTLTTKSEATEAVAKAKMHPVKPTITGEPTVGAKLTATVTGWQPEGVSFSYTWLVDGMPVAGAAGSTYTVMPGDLGKAIAVKVDGTKAGYVDDSATSDSTGAVAAAVATGSVPQISGAAKVGSRLTATPGLWTPPGVSLTYRWFASGAVISGATASSFVVQPAQLGKTIAVEVTGTAVGYATLVKTSAKTAAVTAGTLSAKTPVISGKAKVGSRLAAKAGSWGPSPVTLRYQWYANGKKIAKATKSSYKIAKAYKGKKITVKVTGSKTGYSTVVKASKATKKVM